MIAKKYISKILRINYYLLSKSKITNNYININKFSFAKNINKIPKDSIQYKNIINKKVELNKSNIIVKDFLYYNSPDKFEYLKRSVWNNSEFLNLCSYYNNSNINIVEYKDDLFNILKILIYIKHSSVKEIDNKRLKQINNSFEYIIKYKICKNSSLYGLQDIIGLINFYIKYVYNFDIIEDFNATKESNNDNKTTSFINFNSDIIISNIYFLCINYFKNLNKDIEFYSNNTFLFENIINFIGSISLIEILLCKLFTSLKSFEELLKHKLVFINTINLYNNKFYNNNNLNVVAVLSNFKNKISNESLNNIMSIQDNFLIALKKSIFVLLIKHNFLFDFIPFNRFMFNLIINNYKLKDNSSTNNYENLLKNLINNLNVFNYFFSNLVQISSIKYFKNNEFYDNSILNNKEELNISLEDLSSFKNKYIAEIKTKVLNVFIEDLITAFKNYKELNNNLNGELLNLFNIKKVIFDVYKCLAYKNIKLDDNLKEIITIVEENYLSINTIDLKKDVYESANKNIINSGILSEIIIINLKKLFNEINYNQTSSKSNCSITYIEDIYNNKCDLIIYLLNNYISFLNNQEFGLNNPLLLKLFSFIYQFLHYIDVLYYSEFSNSCSKSEMIKLRNIKLSNMLIVNVKVFDKLLDIVNIALNIFNNTNKYFLKNIFHKLHATILLINTILNEFNKIKKILIKCKELNIFKEIELDSYKIILEKYTNSLSSILKSIKHNLVKRLFNIENNNSICNYNSYLCNEFTENYISYNLRKFNINNYSNYHSNVLISHTFLYTCLQELLTDNINIKDSINNNILIESNIEMLNFYKSEFKINNKYYFDVINPFYYVIDFNDKYLTYLNDFKTADIDKNDNILDQYKLIYSRAHYLKLRILNSNNVKYKFIDFNSLYNIANCNKLNDFKDKKNLVKNNIKNCLL